MACEENDSVSVRSL